jgi:hypothetical protein
VPIVDGDDHGPPGPFRRILREFPRRKIALVLVVVVVNLGVVTCLRGRAIAEARYASPSTWDSVDGGWDFEWQDAGGTGGRGSSNSPQRRAAYRREMIAAGGAPWRLTFVAPWEWTAEEWRHTVWPWK